MIRVPSACHASMGQKRVSDPPGLEPKTIGSHEQQVLLAAELSLQPQLLLVWEELFQRFFTTVGQIPTCFAGLCDGWGLGRSDDQALS